MTLDPAPAAAPRPAADPTAPKPFADVIKGAVEQPGLFPIHGEVRLYDGDAEGLALLGEAGIAEDVKALVDGGERAVVELRVEDVEGAGLQDPRELVEDVAAKHRAGAAARAENEEQRRIEMGRISGSGGILGGQSIIDPEAMPAPPRQTAMMERVTPRSEGGPTENSPADKTGSGNLDEEAKRKEAQEQQEQDNFDKLERELKQKLYGD